MRLPTLDQEHRDGYSHCSPRWPGLSSPAGTSCVTSGHGRAPDGHPVEHRCHSEAAHPKSTRGKEMGKNSSERSDERFSLRGVRMMETSIEMVFLNRCPVSAASGLYS